MRKTLRFSPAGLGLLLALALGACGSSGTSTGTGSSSSSSSGGSSGSSSAPTPAATTPTSSGSGSTTSTATTPARRIIPLGFEGVPLEAGPDLAPASTTGTSKVDGIQCAPVEQLAYHIHAHLSVYVGGTLRAVPGGIGIPGSQRVQSRLGPVAAGGQCIYWLHTHAPDGVIHIESPTPRIYTLGNFFDEWHQALGPDVVAGASGHVVALVDGKPWTGNLRDIPLKRHNQIQLSVGGPSVAFQPISWPANGL